MTPPPASGIKTLAVYALGYTLTIVLLVLDIRHGGTLFTFLGFAVSFAITTHLLYRVARAMAFSPTAAPMEPASQVPSSLPCLAA
jgi:hypothetical protein